MPPETSDVPTWESLIADVRSGPGSDARHHVGGWALDRVRAALGETWPERWHARFGRLPQFVGDPANNALAYAELVETGLRLERLAGTLRLKRLTKEWSQDLQEIRLLHVRLQLEVAALASSLGASVEFEKQFQLPDTRRPADVVISAAGETLIAECFCVYTDDDTAASMTYDRNLGFRLQMMAIDLRLSGHWDVRLPRAETEQLLAEVEQTVAQVLADGDARDVTRSGVELHLAPWSPPDGTEVTLEGPNTPAAGWRRARGIINGKAQDWFGSPVPVWLRFDLLDGTWIFSDWPQRSLLEKTEWMAALAAEAVASTGVAGAVASAGPAIDPKAREEEYVGTGGIVGLRTRLDPLRVRETILIPLSPAGARHKQLWRSIYEAETHWLKDALASASLPTFEEIERGWSVPADRRRMT
jgi:hypothetical protein